MTGVDRAASDSLVVERIRCLTSDRLSKNYMYAKEENWTNN